MNTQSNAMSESFESRVATPAAMSSTRPLYWSVRRELWENRWVYLVPLWLSAVFLFGFLISTFRLASRLRFAASALTPAQYHENIVAPYDGAAGLMMATMILISVFYCADALHSERSDRSILFWKSLPVSDLTTILAKACIPFVVLPVLAFTITIVLYCIMLLMSSVALLGSGLGVTAYWKQFSFFETPMLLLYHLLTAHTLWPAPVYCWLLLVSGWARRATFVWAALPVVAIAAIERITFHSSYFAMIVLHRLIGHVTTAAMSTPDTFPTNPMTHITPLRFLGAPELWIGLAFAAAFLLAAVRLRRYSGPL
jgi:ABC-2 type transport system permease protein